MAFDVGPGDAIFTTPFTFIATAETISLLGAVPVFVDIDPATYNIDPGELEKAITALRSDDSFHYPSPMPPDPASSSLTPKGIIAVDLFGLPADYDRINVIAAENKLFVIEDAAQSFGGSLRGERACSLANIGCTSFFPAKPLGCYGDGGMCFTDDDELASAMQSLRVHGKGKHKYENARIGINGRLDTIQAAILNAKFDIFPEEIDLRNQAAQRYSDSFRHLDPGSITIPEVPEGYQSAWAQYSILAADEKHRAALQAKLKDSDVPTAVYYPKPLHLQAAFKPLGYKEGDFPVSEDCSRRIFSVPFYPYISIEDQKKIVRVMGN
jgi:dTDP-4-amino-4,6-dideoxygalactose transaminase